MNHERMTALRRVLAFGADWLVMALWGGLIFGVVWVVTDGNPSRPANPWQAQAIGLLVMTVPVTLYFALCESSAMQATLGKRIAGLAVASETGERLSFRSALLRNAIKFLPWEFGHTVAQQAIFSGTDGLPAWVWAPLVVASIGPIWWIAALVRSGRTPYDRLARARVARTAIIEGKIG